MTRGKVLYSVEEGGFDAKAIVQTDSGRTYDVKANLHDASEVGEPNRVQVILPLNMTYIYGKLHK